MACTWSSLAFLGCAGLNMHLVRGPSLSLPACLPARLGCTATCKRLLPVACRLCPPALRLQAMQSGPGDTSGGGAVLVFLPGEGRGGEAQGPRPSGRPAAVHMAHGLPHKP